MSDHWEAEIHVWPFSTGHGASVDQEAAGERVRKLTVTADNIGAALRLVQIYADGIQTNPRVWQTPIYGLRRVSP